MTSKQGHLGTYVETYTPITDFLGVPWVSGTRLPPNHLIDFAVVGSRTLPTQNDVRAHLVILS